MDLLTITPVNKIGSIKIPVTIEERYSDKMTTTDHPIEQGAAITDHAYRMPSELVMTCGWTQSSFVALGGAISALFDSSVEGAGTKYIDDIYSQLRSLKDTRTLLNVQSSKRLYYNMLIVGIEVTNDEKSVNTLVSSITMKQISIVSTKATSMPPRANQGLASDTLSTTSGGRATLEVGSPSPGGASPIA